MNKNVFFFVVGLAFLCNSANAQQLKSSNIQYYQEYKNGLQQSILQQNMNNEKSTITSNTSILQVPSFYYNLKRDLPKGAIFCRMEDAIYNRLNFWIKFRMGTDDRYSN